ncbi:MAG: PQQ-dependent sugar dehydrogenase [Candidatus Doudnabacteria bacterium]|nr:PQQ-dependent sugar dehydrogenase [bacterium]MDZ4243481.1 PQQ-dependent sugar dehydrogenase [Candidatus Doudnabacteria bacterium]
MKRSILYLIIILLAGGLIYIFQKADEPGESNSPQDEEQNTAEQESIQIVAENLKIPWAVAFPPASPAGGPDGDILVTERPGNLLKIGRDRSVIKIEGVRHIGEGGLLGLALHPKYEQNNWIYLYLTTNEGGGLRNRVERYTLHDGTLSDRKLIIENIPGASVHDGGRLAFGSDGYLYIGTGDAGTSNLAQDRNSLAGKILRVTDEGETPDDNPFNNAVYSYGHRNVQGLAWDNDGRLWATEHGRSGILSGFDELNLIEKGKNYGWPVIQGDERRDGMVTPVINSGASDTWAPAGAAYVDGSIFFGGLRGEALFEAKLDGTKVSSLTKHFYKEYGRIREVILGPEDYLYITTSNIDGRGNARAGDDKLIRVDLERL